VTFFYSVYGFRLFSNLPILGLAEQPASPTVDIQVRLNQRPPWLAGLQGPSQESFYISPDLDERGNPSITIWKLADGAYFRVLYNDGTEFFLDRLGTRIWATWPDRLTLEDTAVFLRGSILGFVLRLRGLTPLHASAVAVGNQAIALVGPAGAGKSTTAAAFARLGYPVLSDDIVPLLDRGDSFLVQSGYPCLCLWPGSVSSLYGSPDALPLLTPNWDKRYLALKDNGYRFQQEPLTRGAIYSLGERCSDSTGPLVETLPAQAGFLALVSNTYMNYLLDQTMRAREFELLGRVATNVPLRHVRPRADRAHLTRLCEVILNDFQALPPPAFAAADS
jgi:hypothetical protein